MRPEELTDDERTIVEEWCEIVICMGMLVDRIDKLVDRAGCRDRRELMRKLSLAQVTEFVCPQCLAPWQPQNATTCGPCGGYVPTGPVPGGPKPLRPRRN